MSSNTYKQFILQIDALGDGIGAVLSQNMMKM